MKTALIIMMITFLVTVTIVAILAIAYKSEDIDISDEVSEDLDNEIMNELCNRNN